MQEFIVHSVPGSPFGRSVLAALEEKGAPYRLAPLAPGASKTPEHLARHPFGRVPVLDHGDFRLYETQAILRYLDRVLPQPSLTPSDARRAARMDQVMNVNDWYLFQGVGNVIIFHRVIAPRLLNLAPDETAMARLLGVGPYLTGETVSLADLLLAPAIEFFTMTPEWSALGAPHANLVLWLERMQARPSLQATTWERVSELAKAA